MLNEMSILKECDFTTGERELIQMHIDNCNTIAWETMMESWRDKDGSLCIRYSPILGIVSQWYHYNSERKEWW